MIRAATMEDAPAVCRIYNHYIEHTCVTFEEIPVTVTDMENRIRKVTEKYPWLIYEEKDLVLGYSFANAWKDRTAYRYCAESSVYLSHDATGRGVGRSLYSILLSELAAQGVHSVIGGIAQPNPASVALHEKLGFKKVAHFREVGRKFDQWIDVGYWELTPLIVVKSHDEQI
ncbi:MAG: GNAT family N-acetyltransferase [Candidatus Wallbacteria bacterium]|nr:GNAT family N-acetyltransferase [Candidatus Wallbacteria bacterium]